MKLRTQGMVILVGLGLISAAHNMMSDTPSPARSPVEITPFKIIEDTQSPSLEPVAASTPSYAQETADPEKPELIEQDFVKESEKVLNEFPTIEDLSHLPSQEIHHTPNVIAKAGAAIGSLEERVRRVPALSPKMENFYENCIYRDELPLPLRAVCYSNLFKLNSENSILSDSSVPASVRNLAEML